MVYVEFDVCLCESKALDICTCELYDYNEGG